jgi:general secretion pathway protein H
MSKNNGFTLIEILIVIVIIGITVGFALISFGDFGGSKKILFAAEQIQNMLRLAQQQAIMGSSTLGFRINSKSYQLLQFETTNQWRPISTSGPFKIHYLPSDMVITLHTTLKNNKKDPEIIINSLGEISPFKLTFGTANQHAIATLIAKENGELSFTKGTKE